MARVTAFALLLHIGAGMARTLTDSAWSVAGLKISAALLVLGPLMRLRPPRAIVAQLLVLAGLLGLLFGAAGSLLMADQLTSRQVLLDVGGLLTLILVAANLPTSGEDVQRVGELYYKWRSPIVVLVLLGQAVDPDFGTDTLAGSFVVDLSARSGWFFHPNNLASYLMLLIVLEVVFANGPVARESKRRETLIFIALVGLSWLLTGSRSIVLLPLLLVGTSFVAAARVFRRRTVSFVSTTVVGLASLALAAPAILRLMGSGSSGDRKRIALLVEALQQARDSLGLGGGFGSFEYLASVSTTLPPWTPNNAHSLFIEFLAEYGGFGASALLLALLVSISAMVRTSTPFYSQLAVVAALLFASHLPSSLLRDETLATWVLVVVLVSRISAYRSASQEVIDLRMVDSVNG